MSTHIYPAGASARGWTLPLVIVSLFVFAGPALAGSSLMDWLSGFLGIGSKDTNIIITKGFRTPSKIETDELIYRNFKTGAETRLVQCKNCRSPLPMESDSVFLLQEEDLILLQGKNLSQQRKCRIGRSQYVLASVKKGDCQLLAVVGAPKGTLKPGETLFFSGVQVNDVEVRIVKVNPDIEVDTDESMKCEVVDSREVKSEADTRDLMRLLLLSRQNNGKRLEVVPLGGMKQLKKQSDVILHDEASDNRKNLTRESKTRDFIDPAFSSDGEGMLFMQRKQHPDIFE